MALAALPEQIRGSGHVKQASVDRARAARAALLQGYHSPDAAPEAA